MCKNPRQGGRTETTELAVDKTPSAAAFNGSLRKNVAKIFMKAEIHPKYIDSEIRCACGNVIKTRSTKPVIIVGICNVCHPFYTGQQKFVDTAGRVDKFQQRMLKTQAAQAAAATKKKKK